MIRGSCAPVIRPKVAAVLTVVFGLLKFTLLNRLKNSARNCRFISFEKRNLLNKPISTVDRLGPKNSPCSVSPNEPLGFTANAAGLNHTVASEPAGESSGWAVRLARLLPRPQPALSTPLVTVYRWPLHGVRHATHRDMHFLRASRCLRVF